MELLTDPSLFLGLITLVVLEIVLGIDNLIFIAILANKLPSEVQRKRARTIGLSFAMIIRIAMLGSLSWLSGLTEPLFHIFSKSVSGRDLILFLGGVFLLFKATIELHERIACNNHEAKLEIKNNASFWTIIIQIIAIDAVFSIDSVITAIGMVDELSIMIAAVVIAMILMIVISDPLTSFINRYPNIIILCLGFLLTIGLLLVSEGLGYHIPKGYIYTAIAFSLLVEFLNQRSISNKKKIFTTIDLRAKTAEAIHRLLGGKVESNNKDAIDVMGIEGSSVAFNAAERNMVNGVLELAERHIGSIITPRDKLCTISMNTDPKNIRKELIDSAFSKIVALDDVSNEPVGIIDKKNILNVLISNKKISMESIINTKPLVVENNTSILNMLSIFKKSKSSMSFVRDKAGKFIGIVTVTDIIKVIAGDIPD